MRKALRGRWVAVLVTAVLAYFGYHALHGRYGFLAWLDTSRVRSCRFRPLMKQFFWAFAVACVILPVGLVWVAVDADRRSAQDLLLRTRVVYAD